MNGGTPWLGTVAPTTRMTAASATASTTGRRRSIRSCRCSSGRGGSSCMPITIDDHEGDRDRPQASPGPNRRSGRGRPRRRRGRASGRGSRRSTRPRRCPAQRSQTGVRRPIRPPRACSVHQHRAVEGAPEDERPRGSVPEAAEDHRDHQVAVGEPARLAAAAAQRDVQVVAQEAREGHVPAAPEVAKAGRPIRAVEVLREDEAEQQREADRDVRVAGEVAVDLGRVGEGGQDRVGREVRLGHAEHRVDDLAREGVGDQHLLHAARARSG